MDYDGENGFNEEDVEFFNSIGNNGGNEPLTQPATASDPVEGETSGDDMEFFNSIGTQTSSKRELAATSPVEFQARQEARSALRKELATKIDYIREHTENENSLALAERYRKALWGRNFDAADDELANNFAAEVDDWYNGIAEGRSWYEKGYDQFASRSVRLLTSVGHLFNPGNSKEYYEIDKTAQLQHPRSAGDLRDINSAGDAGVYAAEAIGENLPNTMMGMGGSLAGAAVGTMIAPGIGTLIGAALGGFGGTYAMNYGEAVEDQMDEGLEVDRGMAHLQAAGYSTLDGLPGAKVAADFVKAAGKTAIKQGIKGVTRAGVKAAQKEMAKAAAREGMRMTFKKGLKDVGINMLGEFITEPMQSQLVGRGRRYLQTGSAFTKEEADQLASGETDKLTMIFWDSLNEGVGAMLSAGAAGGVTASAGVMRTRRADKQAAANVARYDRALHNSANATAMMQTIAHDADLRNLPMEDQYLFSRRMINEGEKWTLEQEARDTLDEKKRGKINRERRAIEAENDKLEELMSDEAKTLLRAYDNLFATEPMNTIPGGIQSRVSADALQRSRQKTETGTHYEDAATGITIDQDDETGKYVVANKDPGVKIPLTPNCFDDLASAFEFAQNLDRYNQYRAQRQNAKREFIMNLARDVNPNADVYVFDSVTDPNIPDEARGDILTTFLSRDANGNIDMNKAMAAGVTIPGATRSRIYIQGDQIKDPFDALNVFLHEQAHSDIIEMFRRQGVDIEDSEALRQARAKLFGMDEDAGGAELESVEERFATRKATLNLEERSAFQKFLSGIANFMSPRGGDISRMTAGQARRLIDTLNADRDAEANANVADMSGKEAAPASGTATETANTEAAEAPASETAQEAAPAETAEAGATPESPADETPAQTKKRLSGQFAQVEHDYGIPALVKNADGSRVVNPDAQIMAKYLAGEDINEGDVSPDGIAKIRDYVASKGGAIPDNASNEAVFDALDAVNGWNTTESTPEAGNAATSENTQTGEAVTDTVAEPEPVADAKATTPEAKEEVKPEVKAEAIPAPEAVQSEPEAATASAEAKPAEATTTEPIENKPAEKPAEFPTFKEWIAAHPEQSKNQKKARKAYNAEKSAAQPSGVKLIKGKEKKAEANSENKPIAELTPAPESAKPSDERAADTMPLEEQQKRKRKLERAPIREKVRAYLEEHDSPLLQFWLDNGETVVGEFDDSDVNYRDYFEKYAKNNGGDQSAKHFLAKRQTHDGKANHNNNASDLLARYINHETGLHLYEEDTPVDQILDDFLTEHQAMLDWIADGAKTQDDIAAEYYAEEEAELNEARREFEEEQDILFAGVKTSERAALDSIFAEEDARALGFVQIGDPAYFVPFGPEALTKLRAGDNIQIDHESDVMIVDNYNPQTGVLTVILHDGVDMTFSERKFTVGENGFKEITDNGQQEDSVQSDATVPRNEEGAGTGRGEERFALESASRDEIAREKQQAADRAEIERRQTQPITADSVNIQPEFDLGDGGSGDLFSPVAKSEAAPAQARVFVDVANAVGAAKGKTSKKTLDAEMAKARNARFRRSLVTPAEDAAYMDAVKRGDMETAARMVREAAAKAMPDTKVVGEDGLPLVVWHGASKKFTVFDTYNSHLGPDRLPQHSLNPLSTYGWFTDKKSYAQVFATANLVSSFVDIKTPFYIERSDVDAESLEKAKNHLESLKEQRRKIGLSNAERSKIGKRIIVANETVRRIESEGTTYGKLKSEAEKATALRRSRGLSDWKSEGANLRETLREEGFDGVIIIDTEIDGDLGGKGAKNFYIPFGDHPSQIKSADPVTYDDAGNVIPLSQRFNEENPDIRFRRRYTPAEDAAYMDAVKRGDMATAQKMVDDAAKKMGWTIEHLYHATFFLPGVQKFTVFDPLKKRKYNPQKDIVRTPIFFSPDKKTATDIAFAVAAEVNPKAHELAWEEKLAPTVYDVYINKGEIWDYENPYDIAAAKSALDIKDDSFEAEAIEDGAWDFIESPKFQRFLKEWGYDGFYDREGTKNLAVYDNTRIKSSEPVTYDDAGNVIPLSQRFNEENDDIRFRRSGLTQSAELVEAKRQYDEVVARYTNPDGTKKQGWMKAPNGKPTKLTERQWVQVRTENFKRWFGDWENDPANASKVVDENGEPMVVYHGTNAGDFTVFGEHGEDGGAGFYFTTKESDAVVHGSTRQFFLNAKHGMDKHDAFEKYVGTGGNPRRVTIEKMRRDGYDHWTTPGGEIAVFDNRQIKSATDNVGTFDGTNPDIRFRRAITSDSSPRERSEEAYRLGGDGLVWAANVIEKGPTANRFIEQAKADGAYSGDVRDAMANTPTIPFPEGVTEKNGMETLAVTRSADGQSVRKYKLTQGDGVAKVVRKLHDHNELFGEKTAYTFEGVAGNTWDKGTVEPIIIADQPYVEFKKNGNGKARRELLRDMQKRYGEAHWNKDGDELHVGNERFVVSDLKPLNLGIDKATGEYAAIDCNIHRGDGYVNEDAKDGMLPDIGAMFRRRGADPTVEDVARYSNAGEGVTGGANAAINAQYLDRGIYHDYTPGYQSAEDIYEEAGAAAQRGVMSVRRIADDFAGNNARPLTATEEAFLVTELARKRRQITDLNAHLTGLLSDPSATPSQITEANEGIALAEADFDLAVNLLDRGGTEIARALAIRRAELTRDMSLTWMTRNIQSVFSHKGADGKTVVNEEIPAEIRKALRRIYIEAEAAQDDIEKIISYFNAKTGAEVLVNRFKAEVERAARTARRYHVERVGTDEQKARSTAAANALAGIFGGVANFRGGTAAGTSGNISEAVAAYLDTTIPVLENQNFNDFVNLAFEQLPSGAYNNSALRRELISQWNARDNVEKVDPAFGLELFASVAVGEKERAAEEKRTAGRKPGGAKYDFSDPATRRKPLTQEQANKRAEQRHDKAVARINAAEAELGFIPDWELDRFIAQEVRWQVHNGVRNADTLIDKVCEAVDSMGLNADRASVMRILSHYGDKYQIRPSQEEEDVAQRDLRAQVQKKCAIEDALAGRAPQKSGMVRDEPSKEVRDLTKQLHKIMRENNIQPRDRATQLKSALDSIKTRLRNQIEDLQSAIDRRAPVIKREKTAYDAEAEALKAERDKIKAQYDEIFNPALTEEQRLEAALTRLRERLVTTEKETAAIEAGLYEKPVKQSDKFVGNAEYDALRAQLKAAQKAKRKAMAGAGMFDDQRIASLEQRLRDWERKVLEAREGNVQRKMRRVPSEAEQELLDQIWELRHEYAHVLDLLDKEQPDAVTQARNIARRLNRDIAEKEWKIAHNDLDAKPKAKTPQQILDSMPEDLANRLRPLYDKRDALKKEFMQMREQAKFDKASKFMKAVMTFGDFLDVIKNLKASGDISGIMVQCSTWVVAHPRDGMRAIIPGLKALFSEKKADEIMAEIMNMPRAKYYQQAGLGISYYGDAGQRLGLQEDPFAHRVNPFLEKITPNIWKRTGGKLIKGYVDASERGFTVPVDYIRAAAFETICNSVGRELSLEDMKGVAAMVNIATGKGDLEFFKKGGMGKILWAPSRVSAQVQYLAHAAVLGASVLRGKGYERWADVSPDVRKQMFKQVYGKALVNNLIVMSVLGLLSRLLWPDDEDEDKRIVNLDTINPLSTKFMKLNLGGRYVSLAGNIEQYIRTPMQAVLGVKKDRYGDMKDLNGGFGSSGAWSIVEDMVYRNKVAPAVSTLMGLINRKPERFSKEKIETWGDAGAFIVKDGLIPLTAQNMIGAINEEVQAHGGVLGGISGTMFGALEILGLSGYRYDSTEDSRESEFRHVYGKLTAKDATVEDRAILMRKYPYLKNRFAIKARLDRIKNLKKENERNIKLGIPNKRMEDDMKRLHDEITELMKAD